MSQALVIGIVAALPIEVSSFTEKKLIPGESVVLTENMRLCVGGVGSKCAQSAAWNLIESGATALVSWGTAGGLAPFTYAGQLILPDQIRDQQNRVFGVDPAWRKRLQVQLPDLIVHKEAMLQVDKVITSILEKKQLFTQYQAIAVDMESAAIAAVAQQAGVPFMAVRSIVDDCDFALPEWLQSCLDLAGSVKILSLIAVLCCHPSRLYALIRLSRAFFAAQSTLGKVAKLLAATAYFTAENSHSAVPSRNCCAES